MEIHCLGTTGYHPSATRHTACYYIPDWNVVLDAGTGFFRLGKLLLDDPKESLTILLSHAHLDHIIGLTFLIDLMATTSLARVQVIGASEKLVAIQEHLFSQHLFPVLPDCEFVPLSGDCGRRSCSHFELAWFPQEHPGGSLGLVLESTEHRIAYLTDTVARVDRLDVELLRGCDLMLHECYFPDGHDQLAEKTGHSWLEAVTHVVERLRPKQTALIHTDPLMETVGRRIELDDYQREQLRMFIPDDEQVIDC